MRFPRAYCIWPRSRCPWLSAARSHNVVLSFLGQGAKSHGTSLVLARSKHLNHGSGQLL